MESSQPMKRVVVTPAGRRRYLALLARHLEAQKSDFDEWRLWLNTDDAEDEAYIDSLAQKYEWIVVERHPGTIPGAGNYNIHRFFKNCADPGSVYLRLDDDVVWLEPDFVKQMFEFRLAHPEFFLVYANIINNAIVSHIHERNGRVWSGAGRSSYSSSCPVAWAGPEYVKDLHDSFARSIAEGTVPTWHFPLWKLWDYERVSINAISWLGTEFHAFGGQVGDETTDEEHWLSVEKPRQLGKMNAIFGGTCCVHYAFYPQRDALDKTDILKKYEALLP